MFENKDNDSKPKLYPLTHAQKRVWYNEKMHSGMSLHNVGGTAKFKGKIDLGILEKSLINFIHTHDSLHLQFTENEGQVYQYLEKPGITSLGVMDFSSNSDPVKELNAWVTEEAGKTFRILNHHLFRFVLFILANDEYGYFAKFHHLIFDGWSITILSREVIEIYKRLANQREPDQDCGESYLDLISQEREYLDSPRFTRNKKFWLNRFALLPDYSNIKSSHDLRGKRLVFTLDSRMTVLIRKFLTRYQISFNTLFTALMSFCQAKIRNIPDQVIGIPVFNRPGKKQKNTTGMFISTMAFRVDVAEDMNVIDFILYVDRELRKCYINQKYPYDLLVRDLELRKKGYGSLFNTYVNYYNTKLNTRVDDIKVENEEFYNGMQIYSLQLVIKDWLDYNKLALTFDYKTADYSECMVGQLYKSLIYVARQIMQNGNLRLNELKMITPEDKQKIISAFNNTAEEYPQTKSICQLFEEQAAGTPERIALSFNNASLTYREVNEKANHITSLLKNRAVTGNDKIGIYMTHSFELIISILGILKCGAAYVPLDPKFPEKRLSFILHDSKIKIVLTNIKNTAMENAELIFIDSGQLKNRKENEASPLKPAQLAYVLYTSGSTGTPKGVMVGHDNLVNYTWWAKNNYIKSEKDVFAFYSSVSFDLTVTSIFTPLLSGTQLRIYDENAGDEYVLFRILKENQATIIKLTPSHLMLIKDIDHKNSSIRRFILGGEDLKAGLVREVCRNFHDDIEFFNEYGPTEATVGCMIYKYDSRKDNHVSVPIGKPVANTQIYILDNNLEPMPIGAVGELYISGEGVARGYLNNEKLTAEKFIHNPFLSGKRMYRTGDLAGFSDFETIEYAGRKDTQVKIRGNRVELGEIRSLLQAIEGIENGTVLLKQIKDKGHLVAYIVSDKVTEGRVKNYLTQRLPLYMVPEYYIFVDDIPLTVNGKVNEALLPGPGFAPQTGSYIKPRDAGEAVLCRVLAEVLNLKRIGLNDNFYQLGGDSINGILISSKLGAAGYKIMVNDILENPVISEMSLKLAPMDDPVEIEQIPRTGSIKNTPIVRWFFDLKLEKPGYFHQSLLLELKSGLSITVLEELFTTLLAHHDSLRINYDLQSQELYYQDIKECGFKINFYDLKKYNNSQLSQKIAGIGRKIKAGFNPGHDGLFKAALLEAKEKKLLLLVAHHLLIDGFSWHIILEDLAVLVKQHKLKKTLFPGAKTTSYQKWAERINSYGESGITELTAEAVFWNSIFQKDPYSPVVNPGEQGSGLLKKKELALDRDMTKVLLGDANKPFQTKPHELLLILLTRVLFEWHQKREIIIEVEGHGREVFFDDIDISRTVGWFTNIYPLYFSLPESDNEIVVIKELKEQLRRVTPRMGFSYGILKYITKSLLPCEQNHKFVRFNYLGNFDTRLKSGHFQWAALDTGPDVAEENGITSLFDLNIFIVNSGLNFQLIYNEGFIKEEDIDAFLESYIGKMKSFIKLYSQTTLLEFTPSDFSSVDLSQNELDELLF